MPVMNMRFQNDSELYLRAAYLNADAARGISADLLLVDECQDIAPGDLPVLQETLSHSKNGRMILTGTPKLIDNHLEAMFGQSKSFEWTISCRKCSQPFILDERCLGPSGVICPHCKTPNDPRRGRWVARNQGATWGDGFWINHLMVPWLNFDEILERQRAYDFARFKNEVLGLPVTLGDHVVTREEMEACCRDVSMAQSIKDIPPRGQSQLIAGIDWGGGSVSRTVLVIGFMRTDYIFQICYMERFAASEEPNRILSEIARRCEQFRVRWIAADGGGHGHVYNRMLFNSLHRRNRVIAILYSETTQNPRQEGDLIKWTVARSATIGALFSRIKKQSLIFPRVQEVSTFLGEFSCEVAVYDNYHRSIKYSHPETQQDDAMHATNYALLLGIRAISHREDLDY